MGKLGLDKHHDVHEIFRLRADHSLLWCNCRNKEKLQPIAGFSIPDSGLRVAQADLQPPRVYLHVYFVHVAEERVLLSLHVIC